MTSPVLSYTNIPFLYLSLATLMHALVQFLHPSPVDADQELQVTQAGIKPGGNPSMSEQGREISGSHTCLGITPLKSARK